LRFLMRCVCYLLFYQGEEQGFCRKMVQGTCGDFGAWMIPLYNRTHELKRGQDGNTRTIYQTGRRRRRRYESLLIFLMRSL
jgi:hypothetical protein